MIPSNVQDLAACVDDSFTVLFVSITKLIDFQIASIKDE
jgi:hypothetical protein